MEKKKKGLVIALVVAAAAVAAGFLLWSPPGDSSLFQEKAALLRQEALADWMYTELGTDPAGEAGFAVFFSLNDGDTRAKVYTGTGDTPDAAWDTAQKKADRGTRRNRLEPLWVKVDLVYLSQRVPTAELAETVQAAEPGAFHYGVSLDPGFSNALLEGELNGAGLWDHDSGTLDGSALKRYFREAKRFKSGKVPEEVTVFQCAGWLCDGEKAVYALSASGSSCGRRQVQGLNAQDAQALTRDAAAWLTDQTREDGTFPPSIAPQWGQVEEAYNVVHHAGALWALVQQYAQAADEDLKAAIDRAAAYLADQVLYQNETTAYLYEENSDEIKLGGSALAAVAMAEYDAVFETDTYEKVSRALGNGLLAQQDPETGAFCHVLNKDFSVKEQERTVYYDEEAAFALARLYGRTQDETYLAGAQAAARHFLSAERGTYRDHWTACVMNELTKYVTDNADYYAFALNNAQGLLGEIEACERAEPTYLEFLMNTFELYHRMMSRGAEVAGFEEARFLTAITDRALGMLDGYCYPETAMYYQEPDRILHSFVNRQDGGRVSLDNFQHNMSAYLLYQKNYGELVYYGLFSDQGE